MVLLGVRIGPPKGVAIDVGVVPGHLGDHLIELGEIRAEGQIEVCKILRHERTIPRPAAGALPHPAGLEGLSRRGSGG